MNVKTKKSNPDGMVRLETSGKIREIRINEDFLNPKGTSVSICFMGKSSSGIIELTKEEVEFISEKVSPKMKQISDVKIMKFRK